MNFVKDFETFFWDFAIFIGILVFSRDFVMFPGILGFFSGLFRESFRDFGIFLGLRDFFRDLRTFLELFKNVVKDFFELFTRDFQGFSAFLWKLYHGCRWGRGSKGTTPPPLSWRKCWGTLPLLKREPFLHGRKRFFIWQIFKIFRRNDYSEILNFRKFEPGRFS